MTVNAPELKDPVCGMTVTPQSKHQYAHAGTSYYFCSAGCRTKFVADPALYLQKREGPTAPAASAPPAPADGGGLHLLNAPRDHAQSPRRLSDLRHGAGARRRLRQGR